MRPVCVVLILLSSVALTAIASNGRNQHFTVQTDTAVYTISVQRVNSDQPVFAPHSSIFDYNYNPTFIPSSPSSPIAGLLVRCQNNASNPKNPWEVTPSMLSLSALTEPFSLSDLQFSNITKDSIVFAPSGKSDNYGDEDPRVVYRDQDGLYYLLYTAVETLSDDLLVQLSLAITPTPADPSSWQRLGPLFPNISWTKSGALLLRDDVGGPHYLFFGDSSIVGGLQVATTSDLRNFSLNPAVWLPVRSDKFDSKLVEGGPFPIRLSDGNYFMLYNSARGGFPSPNPSYDLQYNVGFVILDKDDPTKILARSDQPILSPELSWETTGLTANVVFAEGWTELAQNQFLVFYGAADTNVGAAVIDVSVQSVTH